MSESLPRVEENGDSRQTHCTMDSIKTHCPTCGASLELGAETDALVCARCGAAFRVHRQGDALNLDEVAEVHGNLGRLKALEIMLEEMDEEIEAAASDIESLRSREKAAPLQMGCALFGAFMAVILVIALFMPLGREYLGGWIFYLTIIIVLALSAWRMRRRLVSRDEVERFRHERERLQAALVEMEAERDRLHRLREEILGSASEDD
ncbi:MAG: hypothetical protein AB1631_32435 [Acidobacteriota bacterium]